MIITIDTQCDTVINLKLAAQAIQAELDRREQSPRGEEHPSGLTAEERAFTNAGLKIEAIKGYRALWRPSKTPR